MNMKQRYQARKVAELFELNGTHSQLRCVAECIAVRFAENMVLRVYLRQCLLLEVGRVHPRARIVSEGRFHP